MRFNLIDIFECPKIEVIEYLENERLGKPLGQVPYRRARVYYHFQSNRNLLYTARVNVTRGIVEGVQSLENVQGPVDFDEWSAVDKACNEHPSMQ